VDRPDEILKGNKIILEEQDAPLLPTARRERLPFSTSFLLSLREGM
jgi:hypothetical protein